MYRFLFTTNLVLLSLISLAQKQSDTLTNEKVIKMVKSGISEALIKKSVEASRFTNFDLSSDGLIKLSQAKVSDNLILAMFDKKPLTGEAPSNTVSPTSRTSQASTAPEVVEADLTKLAPGIYYALNKRGTTEYIKLNGVSAFRGVKRDAFIGVAQKNYYSINGKKAITQVNQNQPVFYIVGGIGANNVSFEPTRFIVLRAELEKNNRIVTQYKGLVGHKALYNSSFDKKSGAVEPTYSRISNTIYKVTFEKKFPAGNYFFGPSQISSETHEFFEFDIIM